MCDHLFPASHSLLVRRPDHSTPPTMGDTSSEPKPAVYPGKPPVERDTVTEPPPPDSPAPASPAPSAHASGSAAAIMSLAARYREELEFTVGDLKRSGNEVAESVQKSVSDPAIAVAHKEKIVAALSDMSDIAIATMQVMQTLIWSSVLIFAASFGFFVGGFVLGPLLALLIGPFGAFAAAYILLPAIVYYQIARETSVAGYSHKDCDRSIRYRMLGFALIEGILAGFMLRDRFVTAQPVSGIIPLMAAVVYQFTTDTVGRKRATVLGCVIGGPLAVALVLPLLVGCLTASYFIMSILVSAGVFVCLQLMFKYVTEQQQPTYNYQLGLLVVYLISKALTYVICGQAYAETVRGTRVEL